jgi:hypothetical protein
MSELRATQRWIQDVVTELGEDGPASATARERPPAAEAVVRGSAGFGPSERLALYNRTYRRRLTGCLRDGYPALRQALGDELFDDFALD